MHKMSNTPFFDAFNESKGKGHPDWVSYRHAIMTLDGMCWHPDFAFESGKRGVPTDDHRDCGRIVQTDADGRRRWGFAPHCKVCNEMVVKFNWSDDGIGGKPKYIGTYKARNRVLAEVMQYAVESHEDPSD